MKKLPPINSMNNSPIKKLSTKTSINDLPYIQQIKGSSMNNPGLNKSKIFEASTNMLYDHLLSSQVNIAEQRFSPNKVCFTSQKMKYKKNIRSASRKKIADLFSNLKNLFLDFHGILELQRSKIIDWMVQVFRVVYDNDTAQFCFAVDLMDRYLYKKYT